MPTPRLGWSAYWTTSSQAASRVTGCWRTRSIRAASGYPPPHGRASDWGDRRETSGDDALDRQERAGRQAGLVWSILGLTSNRIAEIDDAPRDSVRYLLNHLRRRPLNNEHQEAQVQPAQGTGRIAIASLLADCNRKNRNCENRETSFADVIHVFRSRFHFSQDHRSRGRLCRIAIGTSRLSS